MRTVCLSIALVSVAVAASAQDTIRSRPERDTTPRSIAAVKIVGRIDDLIGVATSASEGHVGAAELRLRPIIREGELLEAVPGMIVTQHSGEGKANQYFVRGFNLDHGTDFQTKLDGMPINMPTHGHGQGYTDLNFLIPELVDNIDYKLGVYHADVGDFGSAGGAELHLVRSLDKPFVALSTGANGLARIAGGSTTPVGSGELLVGGEAKSYNGPWLRAEDIRKLSGVSRYSWQRGTSQFSVLAMAYNNTWNANDQVPDRAVDDGMISRFGQIDSTDGGESQRYSLSASWRHVGSNAVDDVQLYGIRSQLALFSDFTYFLDNPVKGDQFSQTDRRTIVGGSATRSYALDFLDAPLSLALGVQTRADFIDPVGLYRTQRRIRYETVREDRVDEVGSGLFVEAESRWSSMLRTTLGIRGDVYSFDVRSSLSANSGTRVATIASPKASIVFTPSSRTELYASAGYGFHSNDARGTTITVDPSTGEPTSRVNPLVRSRGSEVGTRVSFPGGLRSTLSVWALNLDSELLFTGDAGTTEPAAESHRRGVTLANFYQPLPRLSLDADVSLARARFVGVEPGQTHIPGAIERVVAAGASWSESQQGVFGSIRLRHFGDYPLVEDNSVRARPSTLVSAEAGYRLMSGTRLQLTVLNVFDNHAEDIQYYYASRLRGEPSDGIDGIHSHPVEPRQIRIGIQRVF